MSVALFYTPWIDQKNRGFLIFSGGIEGSQQYKIGQVSGSCQMLLDFFCPFVPLQQENC